MIRKLLLAGSLLPVAALAQFQVFQFDGTNYTLADSLVDVGTASAGDTIVTRFRVRNMGSAPVTLHTISLAGEAFAIKSVPSLPYTLSPYVGPASEAEIDTTFSPTFTASYSATLAIDDVSIVLQGTAGPSTTLSMTGTTTPIAAGAVIDFGSVPIGSTKTLSFVLSNSTPVELSVGTLEVSGPGFTGPIGVSPPVDLAAGQSVPFQITFTPVTGTLSQGVLAVDSRTFVLKGQGLAEPLPAASIVFASTAGASAQQNSVSISLASAAQQRGAGTLTMTFQPSVAGVTDDPAIEYLSGPARQASVNIAPGDKSATIGGESSMPFQTGSTAGTITFTLTLNGGPAQTSTLNIAPSPIVLDSFTAVRQLGALAVSFAGFDNTYSASQLSFTFYDLKGLVLPQGSIAVDASVAFHQYFATTQAGGTFGLLATFPVIGDTSQIGFVMAQMANSAGSTTAQQISIGN